MSIAFIYLLFHPDVDMKYIGSTTQSPHVRLAQHISASNKNKSMNFFIQHNEPEKWQLRVLYTFSYDKYSDVLKKEQQYIDQYEKDGHLLMNMKAAAKKS